MTTSGNYLFFIIMHLDSDLAHYYSALHLPFFSGKEKKKKSCNMYALNDVISLNR